ncbi:MAG TPA: low specificity L-threonine aldolase, partial [Paludibacteraceae bacterium]|nr:low specificity L-threonine aldolase [Paludibacteraceae bacterium]
MKSFASDNYSGVHPDIMNAILEANKHHAISYGDDTITEETNRLFEKIFGEVKVLYAFNGTGANVVALKCCTLPFQSVICAETAHIQVDECGAPTQSIGCSLVALPTPDGKLTPELIRPELKHRGNLHHTQPKVISISQTTELGTIYSPDELKALSNFAHENDLYLHVDGARISNAVAALGCSLKEATVDCGIDIMSFGGTKNGLMIGEAILIFNKELWKNAPYLHKQSAQLFSKNRFIAAQFKALLENELWRTMALHSNKMAQLLKNEIIKIKGVILTQDVQANSLFVIIPAHAVEPLREAYRFYDWNTATGELRWMCSFDTTEEDVLNFVTTLKSLL